MVLQQLIPLCNQDIQGSCEQLWPLTGMYGRHRAHNQRCSAAAQAFRAPVPSEVLQQLVALGDQDIDGSRAQLLRPQDARGLHCVDEVVLALAQLHAAPPGILP